MIPQGELIEGNNLIAEFDGIKWKPVYAGYERGHEVFVPKYFDTQEKCLEYCNEVNAGKRPDNCYFPLPDVLGFALKYHTSWDQLMPVVGKILWYYKNDHVDLKTQAKLDNVIEELSQVDITKTWFSVVEFIKWYNQKCLMNSDKKMALTYLDKDNLVYSLMKLPFVNSYQEAHECVDVFLEELKRFNSK